MGKKGGNKNRPKKPNQPDSTQQAPKSLAPVTKSQDSAVVENSSASQVNQNNQNVNPNPDGIQIIVNNNEEREEKKQDLENGNATPASNTNSSTEEAESLIIQEKESSMKIEEIKKAFNYITVLDDSSNFNVKFPLKNKWTFWFDKPSSKSQSNWGDHLEKIYTFEYIEDFWRLYNNIEPVSKLASQSNYHLFKEGIVPKWEDPMNENGGRWMCNIDKSNKFAIDEYFLKAMLACIGEQITSNDDEICGVVVSRKHSEDRLALWCYSTPDESSITKKCGIRFKELLGIPQETKLFFQSAKDGKSGARAIPSASNYIL